MAAGMHTPCCYMMLFLRISFWSLITCLITPAVNAEVYKWTDKDGRIHYGDRPTAADAETIEVKPAPQPDTGIEERREKQRKLLELINEEREEDKQKQVAIEREKKERQINCENVKKYYEQLKTAGGLFKEGEDGNRVVLTDEERVSAETQAMENMEYWCD